MTSSLKLHGIPALYLPLHLNIALPFAHWRCPPSRLVLLWLLALAPLVEVLAAVADLLGGPRQLQAVHAVVVPGVAVVHVGVRGRGLARRRQSRGGRQLRGAAPLGRLAAVELLLAGPAAHPLQRVEVVVSCVAIDGARRRGRGRAPLVLHEATLHLLRIVPRLWGALGTISLLLGVRRRRRRRGRRRRRRRRRGRRRRRRRRSCFLGR